MSIFISKGIDIEEPAKIRLMISPLETIPT